MKRILRIVPALLILAVGAWGWNYFSNSSEDESTTKPKLSKSERKAKQLANAQQTKVLKLTSIDFPILLESHGIVRAPAVTSLTPQVAGLITKISANFENGSFVSKGEILVELDQSDFLSEISSSKASLARAEAAQAQENARAAQALRNWEDIGFDEKPNELVLRKPQLKEAEANVAAQLAALERSMRKLERSKIRAPYSGRVRSRDIGLGQSVGTGTKLGEIYATAYAEIRLPLSIRQLAQIDIQETDFKHIPTAISDSLNPQNNASWEASVVRIEGELDPTSRELFVVARVEDPFGIHGRERAKPLRMNQPVTAKIEANTLRDVVKIPRSAIYGKDEVIIIKDNLIHRKTINVVWSTLDSVLTDTAGLTNELLATSKLSYAPEASPVRIIEEPANQTATTVVSETAN